MELINSLVFKIKNQKFSSNSYILKDKCSDCCLLIDPGLDFYFLDEKIGELNLKPIAILSTHGHFDHVGGVSYFQNKFKIPFYIHEGDFNTVKSVNFFLKIAKIDIKIETPKPNVLFKNDLEIFTIGNFKLSIYNYPGHTNGSCIIQSQNFIFTGDMIYRKGLGFNNFPGEDKIKLKHSIKKLFKIFPDDCCVYPGHGGADYLFSIKKNNQELINFLNS